MGVQIAPEWVFRLGQNMQNNHSVQRELGLCYEQGFSEAWCEAAKKIMDIEKYHLNALANNSEYLALEKEITAIFDKESILLKNKTEQLKDEYGDDARRVAKEQLSEELKAFDEKTTMLSNKIKEIYQSILTEDQQNLREENMGIVFSSKAEFLALTTDKKKAVQCYQQAVESGNIDALLNLGFCYLRGMGVALDIHKGIALIEDAAMKGHTDAIHFIGDCYAKGMIYEKNTTLAHQCWKKTVVSKYPKSKNNFFKISSLFSSVNPLTGAPIFQDPIDHYSDFLVEPDIEEYERMQWKMENEYKAKATSSKIALDNIVIDYLESGNIPSSIYRHKDQIGTTDKHLKDHEKRESAKINAGICDFSTVLFEAENFDLEVWVKRYIAGICYAGQSDDILYEYANTDDYSVIYNDYNENYNIFCKNVNNIKNINKNQAKALALWEEMLHDNDPVAYYRLGCHYLSENTYIDIAKNYLEKSAEFGFHLAYLKLAECYFYGLFGVIDYTKSCCYIDKHIANNHGYLAKDILTLYSFIPTFDEFVFGHWWIPHIEMIGLCTAVLQKSPNAIEFFDQSIRLLDRLSSRFLFKEKRIEFNTVDLAQELAKDNPAIALLCYYFFTKNYAFYFDDTSTLKSIIKRSSTKKDLSDHVIDSFIRCIDNQQVTINDDVFFIVDNDDVFGELFEFFYDLNNYLILGLLYYYKSLSKRSINSEFDKQQAIEWLELSNHPLSKYYRALFLEESNPELALDYLNEVLVRLKPIDQLDEAERLSLYLHIDY